MELKLHIIRVFVASPGDTAEERNLVREAVDDINRHHGRLEHFRVDLLLWEEDSYPDVGADAQDVINRQIGDYDLFIGLMSTKCGSPTTRANSGTEEEFERAYQKLLENPTNLKILFYFRNATIKILDADLYQGLQIQRFRDRIGSLGVRYQVYESTSDFRRHIGNHLLQAVHDIIRGSEIPTRPRSALSKTVQTVELPDWQATKNPTFPQWANYRDVPLEKYSYSSFSLEGVFTSDSPYFRFGFRLLSSKGNLFGEGTVQSKDANVVVHIGKNTGSNALSLTSYHNGLRQGSNKAILDYSLPREVRIEFSVGDDNVCRLVVDRHEVYQLHISPAIKKRLMIVAWGDEHEYEVHFKDIRLRLT
jgi:hypothetical protein